MISKKFRFFLFRLKKGSLSGISSDEQKEVFQLTSTAEKPSAAPKKRKTQTTASTRKQKTTKNSTTYDNIRIDILKEKCLM